MKFIYLLYMSSNDNKKYWQVYYAKNKQKILARIKSKYDGKKQMTNHKIRYHTDKEYRIKCLIYCRKYKQKKLNLPKFSIPIGNDKSLFVLDFY